MKNTKTDPKQEELDDDIEGKIVTEVQWDIYREQFERDKISKPKVPKKEFDDDEEYIEEVIQQLKGYQQELEKKEQRQKHAVTAKKDKS